MRLTLVALLWPAAAAAQSLSPVTDFGSNPGDLAMYEYVPGSAPTPAPAVVLLPGCNQSAGDFAADAGWLEAADRWGLALVVAEQKISNNISGCFNWFSVGDTARDQGEAQSIAQMLATAVATHGLDGSRVYSAGISAGGCMVAVMLATYPELFAGGAIFAGVPYGCAESAVEGWSCMDPGEDRTPAAWGDLVRAASSHTGPWPAVSIWHGSADTNVLPVNLGENREQWLDVHGLGATPDAEETVGSALHRSWNNEVETWELTGMDHAVPVAPSAGCGNAATFSRDVGICAPDELARLWGLDPNTDDGAPNTDGGTMADGAPFDGGRDGGSPGDSEPGDYGSPVRPSGQNDRGCTATVPSLWMLALVALVRRLHNKR